MIETKHTSINTQVAVVDHLAPAMWVWCVAMGFFSTSSPRLTSHFFL
jgi:hypothetical protein